MLLLLASGIADSGSIAAATAAAAVTAMPSPIKPESWQREGGPAYSEELQGQGGYRDNEHWRQQLQEWEGQQQQQQQSRLSPSSHPSPLPEAAGATGEAPDRGGIAREINADGMGSENAGATEAELQDDAWLTATFTQELPSYFPGYRGRKLQTTASNTATPSKSFTGTPCCCFRMGSSCGNTVNPTRLPGLAGSRQNVQTSSNNRFPSIQESSSGSFSTFSNNLNGGENWYFIDVPPNAGSLTVDMCGNTPNLVSH